MWINKYFKIFRIWFWDVIRYFSGCMWGKKLLFKIGKFIFFKDDNIVVWNVDKLIIWLVFFNGNSLFLMLFVNLKNCLLYILVVGIIF